MKEIEFLYRSLKISCKINWDDKKKYRKLLVHGMYSVLNYKRYWGEGRNHDRRCIGLAEPSYNFHQCPIITFTFKINFCKL